MVRFTEPAGIVPDLGSEEAEGRGQWYIGPEHLLVGLLQGLTWTSCGRPWSSGSTGIARGGCPSRRPPGGRGSAS
jgi:hypothetical protein